MKTWIVAVLFALLAVAFMASLNATLYLLSSPSDIDVAMSFVLAPTAILGLYAGVVWTVRLAKKIGAW